MNATSTGALLLCRADPETVRPLAHLLREQMLLTRAGEEWSVLVPEGKPWRGAGPSGGGDPPYAPPSGTGSGSGSRISGLNTGSSDPSA
ncbi:hypothetical protein ACWEQJ_26465, partial [Streptomyces cyaneofuscatus]